MVYNSLQFAVFFPIVVGLYYLVGRQRQNTLLLLASYLFYGAWDVRFLHLLSVSTVIDYCVGLMIAQGAMTTRQRLAPSAHVIGFALAFLIPDWSAVRLQHGGVQVAWQQLATPGAFGIQVTVATVVVVGLAHAFYPRLSRLPERTRRLLFLRLSLVGQLGLLGVFKYYNFFVDSADTLLQRFGTSAAGMHMDIVLPIGISFFTFQTLSYTCDVYFGRVKPVQRYRDFAVFVAYFPPLVAGPIERARHLLPSLLEKRTPTLEGFAHGTFLILFGLFKKVAIADGLAASVDSIYLSSGSVGWLDVALATVAFAFQIYCDFSGYSDIARGVSRFFGIELLRNFELPYFSINPSEFWRRWHISLSTWLRDYLYIPLGGNRGSEGRTHRNLMLTMVLGGLWHGAAWNFVLWGAYQGVLLVGHRILTRNRPPAAPAAGASALGALLWRLPRMAFFFVFVCYGWLLFRAVSLDQIVEFTAILFTDMSDMTMRMKRPNTSALLGLPLLLLFDVTRFVADSPHYYRRVVAPIRAGAFALLFLAFLLGTSNEAQQFIYFQF